MSENEEKLLEQLRTDVLLPLANELAAIARDPHCVAVVVHEPSEAATSRLVELGVGASPETRAACLTRDEAGRLMHAAPDVPTRKWLGLMRQGVERILIVHHSTELLITRRQRGDLTLDHRRVLSTVAP